MSESVLCDHGRPYGCLECEEERRQRLAKWREPKPAVPSRPAEALNSRVFCPTCGRRRVIEPESDIRPSDAFAANQELATKDETIAALVAEREALKALEVYQVYPLGNVVRHADVLGFIEEVEARVQQLEQELAGQQTVRVEAGLVTTMGVRIQQLEAQLAACRALPRYHLHLIAGSLTPARGAAGAWVQAADLDAILTKGPQL